MSPPIETQLFRKINLIRGTETVPLITTRARLLRLITVERVALLGKLAFPTWQVRSIIL